jgi:hypothetical protein
VGPVERARWQQARKLLHDDSISAEDRVAGLLVLLYAQLTATVGRLTFDAIPTGADVGVCG